MVDIETVAEPHETDAEPLRSPFRGRTNKLRTSGLFLEPTLKIQGDPEFCLYTILSDGRNPRAVGLISARDTYISMNDTTGYSWAMKYLEDYDHFMKLMGVDWFKETVGNWNKQIAARDRAEAIRTLKALSKDEGVSHGVRVSAAKYVAEEGWKKAEVKRSAGRPSKQAVTKEVKEAARKLTAVESDAERIGLKLVGGTAGG